MRILLLSPPFVPEYMRNARCDFVSLSGTQWYPILLGYCGAYLESKGHQVLLIDAPAANLDHEQTREAIRKFRPELLVVYTGLKSCANDLEFVDRLREETPCEAIIAGPYASIDPEKTLKASRSVQYLAVGEFEKPVEELADGRPADSIANLVRKDGNRVVRNAVRPYLTGSELDEIPFVSRFFRDHLDLRNYRTISEPYPFMDILSGRGCHWGRCTYCLWVHTFVKGATYNCRSIGNVIEEFRFIETEMPGIRSVMIQDDTFPEERAAEFAEARIRAGLRLPWSCYARPVLGRDTLRLMKRSGCLNLHVGYESASPAMLKNIKKGVTVEKMTEFTRAAKEAGVRIHGDFLIGLPGETPEEAMKTIEWACRINPSTAQFQLMIPFPGTVCHAEMQRQGWLNGEGQPDMPQFSNREIRRLAKLAYRRFYLSPQYCWKCLCHPYDYCFGRMRAIIRAVPAIFWEHWNV